MLSLWTLSKLSRLPSDLRRKIVFYAPLTDSLDFKGNDPVSFTRAGASTATRRDGLLHAVAANVPRFEYDGELPLGLKISSGETLQFSAQNELDNSNTLIWFEDGVPMSTPTNANPFSFSGAWAGDLDVHVKHVVKLSAVIANSEIQSIQSVLEDVEQFIPEPLPPGASLAGFSFETPGGPRNGTNTVFTLSQDADITNPSFGICFGGGIVRVDSSPDNFEYTLSGAGNRTVTMGLAPTTDYPFKIGYFVAS